MYIEGVDPDGKAVALLLRPIMKHTLHKAWEANKPDTMHLWSDSDPSRRPFCRWEASAERPRYRVKLLATFKINSVTLHLYGDRDGNSYARPRHVRVETRETQSDLARLFRSSPRRLLP